MTPGSYFVDVVDASVPARFNLSTANDPTSPITIVPGQSYRDTDIGYVTLDLGDAPDPFYPTTIASNGARHVVDASIYLGSSVDGDADGHQYHITAICDDADGNDDEDGVIFTRNVSPGRLVGVEVTASLPGRLNAWIDFNRDGDWVDPDEHVFVDTPLVAGLNTLDFLTPPEAVAGTSFARFRFSSLSGLSVDGFAPDGEVEDYQVEILPAVGIATGSGSIGDFVWLDLNEDGIQDSGEPGIDGIVVQLTNDTGSTSITTTGLGGHYQFSDLPAGVYTVTLDDTSVPTGFDLETTPNPAIVSLPPDGNIVDVDFGFAPPASNYSVTNHLTTHTPARPKETVIFSIEVTNTGDTWLTDLSLQDVYDPAYLAFKNSDPVADETENDGVLDWSNLTDSFGLDLAPGEGLMVTVTFEAVKDTTNPRTEPNGTAVTTATITGAWADPDANGPLGALIFLPEQSKSDEIQIILPTGVTMVGPQVQAEAHKVMVNWETV